MQAAQERKAGWQGKRREGELSFNHLWTLHALNGEHYLLRINRGFQRRHTDGQWSRKKTLMYSVMSDSMNLRGSSVHGVFQARILEWGAVSFSMVSS